MTFDVTFITPYVTKCDVLSHAINRMEKKIKWKGKNINNDLGFKGWFMTDSLCFFFVFFMLFSIFIVMLSPRDRPAFLFCLSLGKTDIPGKPACSHSHTYIGHYDLLIFFVPSYHVHLHWVQTPILWFTLDRPSDIRSWQLSLMDGCGS